MKKIGLFGIIVLIVMIISTATATVTAFATGFEYRVLHNGVNLYSDETLTSVSKELKQNDCVEVLEERNIGGNDFYKVKIDDVIGYVDTKYVYATTSKANISQSGMRIALLNSSPPNGYCQPFILPII